MWVKARLTTQINVYAKQTEVYFLFNLKKVGQFKDVHSNLFVRFYKIELKTHHMVVPQRLKHLRI